MTEQEANEVMDWIADVSSWNPEDVVIKHLYDLHRLRDQKLCDELAYEGGYDQHIYARLYDMQTWYY